MKHKHLLLGDVSKCSFDSNFEHPQVVQACLPLQPIPELILSLFLFCTDLWDSSEVCEEPWTLLPLRCSWQFYSFLSAPASVLLQVSQNLRGLTRWFQGSWLKLNLGKREVTMMCRRKCLEELNNYWHHHWLRAFICLLHHKNPATVNHLFTVSSLDYCISLYLGVIRVWQRETTSSSNTAAISLHTHIQSPAINLQVKTGLLTPISKQLCSTKTVQLIMLRIIAMGLMDCSFPTVDFLAKTVFRWSSTLVISKSEHKHHLFSPVAPFFPVDATVLPMSSCNYERKDNVKKILNLWRDK